MKKKEEKCGKLLLPAWWYLMAHGMLADYNRKKKERGEPGIMWCKAK